METISPFFMLIPIAIAVVCIGLTVIAVRAEMRDKGTSSRHLASMVTAIAIVLLFYPTTIAPIGALSNGGLKGFSSLVIASGFSWWAFLCNRKSPWIRRLIQLPVTALITFMAISDACRQCLSGWRW